MVRRGSRCSTRRRGPLASHSGRPSPAGVDYRQLDLAWLRAHMAVVDQEPFLFDGTVRRAVLLGCARTHSLPCGPLPHGPPPSHPSRGQPLGFVPYSQCTLRRDPRGGRVPVCTTRHTGDMTPHGCDQRATGRRWSSLSRTDAQRRAPRPWRPRLQPSASTEASRKFAWATAGRRLTAGMRVCARACACVCTCMLVLWSDLHGVCCTLRGSCCMFHGTCCAAALRRTEAAGRARQVSPAARTPHPACPNLPTPSSDHDMHTHIAAHARNRDIILPTSHQGAQLLPWSELAVGWAGVYGC